VAIAGLSSLLIKNEWMPSCLAIETHQTPGANKQPLNAWCRHQGTQFRINSSTSAGKQNQGTKQYLKQVSDQPCFLANPDAPESEYPMRNAI
jgi:hypothetical protein